MPILRCVMIRAYYSSRPDAITVAMSELARTMSANGHSVSVLSLGSDVIDAPPEQVSLGRHADSWGRFARPVEQFRFSLFALAWLITNRRSYDVIITVDTPVGIGYIGRLAALICRRLHVSWVMDLFYVQNFRLHGSGLLARALATVEFRSTAENVVTLGRCMAAEIRKWAPGRMVTVIPIWAPESTVLNGARSGVPDQRTFFYGGNAGGRNPLEWIRALPMMPGVQIRIHGSGPEIDKLRALKDRPDILLGGRLSDAEYRRISEQAAAHIVTLAFDAAGTSVPSKAYASMAMGRAVIFLGDPNTQVAQDIRDAEAGVVIPTFEPSILQERWASLPDRAELEAMGARGRTFVMANRRSRHGAEQWEKYLNDLLNRRHTGRKLA